jgi:hypothetical protein
MCRFWSFVFATIVFISSAQAQQSIAKYDANVIDSSIKCELSRVAKLYGPQRADGPAMQAVVNVKGTETITKKVGGNVIFGVNYETTSSIIRGFKGTRNINVDNSINCRKSNIVDVGLYACFKEEKSIFFSGQAITCGGGSTASADFSAGGKITWVLEVSLSGDYTKKREWTIDVQAPPDKK